MLDDLSVGAGALNLFLDVPDIGFECVPDPLFGKLCGLFETGNTRVIEVQLLASPPIYTKDVLYQKQVSL